MEITYRMLVAEDYEDVIKITNDGINAEQEYHAYIRELCDSLSTTTVGIAALCGDRLVGVTLCARGMELTGGREDFFDKIREDIAGEEIWSGCVVAVDKDFQKLHIGSEMQKRCMKALRKRGGRHLLLEIWVHPDGAEPSCGSVKLVPSYTDYGVVPDFYNIPALAGHVCQLCGGTCRCGARIAVLHLFPKIEYRLAKKDDFEKVMQLSAKYIDASDAYRSYIGGLHETLGTESLEMLAFCGERLVGLFSVFSGMHLTGDRQDYFDEIRAEAHGKAIWSTGFVTVDPEFQGYDIAKEMHIRMFESMREMNIAYLLAEIWVRPDGYMPSRKLLHSVCDSVKEYGPVERFYADIPRPEGVECQVCGKDCHCKAIIAVARL